MSCPVVSSLRAESYGRTGSCNTPADVAAVTAGMGGDSLGEFPVRTARSASVPLGYPIGRMRRKTLSGYRPT
jgi:hypothetical protein